MMIIPTQNKLFLKLTNAIDFLITQKPILLIFVLGFMTYANTLFFPFVHDDIIFIVQNPQISQWEHLASIFLTSVQSSLVAGPVNAYYRPILDLFSKIQYFFFGLNPMGYHLVNILLHLVNGMLVYHITQILSKDKRMAFFIAVLFVVHPAQSDAVSAIAGVSNILFSLFCLLSFFLYLRARLLPERKPWTKPGYYAVSLGLFLLALLTKEQAAVLPFLIIAYEACFYPIRGNGKKILLRSGGFLIILIAYGLFRQGILGSSTAGIAFEGTETWLRLLTIPKVIVSYIGILFFPVGLHYYRSTDILSASTWWMAGLLGVFYVIGMLLGLTKRSERGLGMFALIWFFLSLIPICGILPIINEYSLILTAVHFLYFPIFGFLVFVYLALRQGARALFHDRAQGALEALLIFIVTVLTIVTIFHNQYWRSEIALFERTLSYQKDFGRGRILLAKAYYFKGDYQRAIIEYQHALEIMQGYVQKAQGSPAESFYLGFIKDIYFDLAQCYLHLGHLANAQYAYYEALALSPHDPLLNNSLGIFYLSLGNSEQSKKYLEKARELLPQDVSIANNLAVAYIQSGEKQRARQLLEAVLEENPQNELIRGNLDRLLREVNTP